MDPFEEFEFKPLTEGLGFHKRKPSTATIPAEEDLAFEINAGTKLSSMISPKVEPEMDLLKTPLPRKSSPAALSIEPEQTTASSAVDEILKTLQNNRRLDFENQMAQASSARNLAKETYKPDTWSLSSCLLDSMLVGAASLLCMIIVLMITKADLIANLTNPDPDGMIYIATFGLIACVSLVYLTINRTFLGSTPGEWAFEQRVGKPEEMTRASYPVRILGRSILVIMTGFVLLPIFSLILGRDIAGEITGAPLLKKAT